MTIDTQQSSKLSPEETKHFKESIDWEKSKINMYKKSQKRAWVVTSVFGVLTLTSWLAIVLMMPLKTTIPYLIRVDNTTGVPDIITIFDSKEVAFEEVLDKYWLGIYVGARERYDLYTIQDDYDTVGLLSSSNVGAEYATLFTGENAIDKVYQNKIKKDVRITSISFNPTQEGLATVRFSVQTKRTDGEMNAPIVKWVATIGYEYQDISKMKESDRLKNPFGFQVLSYRIDPESN